MEQVARKVEDLPTLVRPMPEPPGLYLRTRREDRAALLQLFSSGTTNMSGLVFDPSRMKQDKELRDLVTKHQLDAVLDPKTQQLGTPYGFSEKLGALAWGNKRVQVVEDFLGQNGQKKVRAISAFAQLHGVTAVLAPTHLIGGSSDPWLAADVDATKRLRDELNGARSKVAIFYSLALPYSVFRDHAEREAIIRTLEDAPIDQLWLKIDGLGNHATPAGVGNYIEACRDFHGLQLPLLADHFGGFPGLSLVAMGAVTGLAHGITVGEQFDSSPWVKPRDGNAYSLRTRVYVPKIDVNLDAKIAKRLVERNPPVRAMFGCHDRNCCERGLTDMLEYPSKHFAYQRMRQMDRIGRVPSSMRAREFVDNELRQLTEDLIKATNLVLGDDQLERRLVLHRRRLDGLRVMLSKHLATEVRRTTAVALATRRAREATIR